MDWHVIDLLSHEFEDKTPELERAWNTWYGTGKGLYGVQAAGFNTGLAAVGSSLSSKASSGHFLSRDYTIQ